MVDWAKLQEADTDDSTSSGSIRLVDWLGGHPCRDPAPGFFAGSQAAIDRRMDRRVVDRPLPPHASVTGRVRHAVSALAAGIRFTHGGPAARPALPDFPRLPEMPGCRF